MAKFKKKRAMFSIYAFCRMVDDIADELDNKRERVKTKEMEKENSTHL